MTDEKQPTIAEEITSRGIYPCYFDTVYDLIFANQKLPPKDTVPENQYNMIVSYLTDKHLIGRDGTIQRESLVLFDSKKKVEDEIRERDLEQRMEDEARQKEEYEREEDLGSGGHLPCVAGRGSWRI